MVRMKVYLKQHNEILPIIEVELELYYDKIFEAIAYSIISKNVAILEEVVNSNSGKFCNIEPRGTVDKNAKMGVFMTIAFQNMLDMKKFKNDLGKVLQ